MQTNLAVEQNKTLNGPGVRRISPVGKKRSMDKRICRRAKVLSSEWKTERRVREDESGDSEDVEDEDDELSCVIGEREGDCVWPSDEAGEEQWGVCFIDNVQQPTEESDSDF